MHDAVTSVGRIGRRRPAGGKSVRLSARADAEATPEELARQAYAVAVRLLGARDHSSAELTRKLGQRDFDETAIAAALSELRAANYLDDERFARALAEQRMSRGNGPNAIRARLRERGIDGGLADEAIEALGADWVERAGEALASRFDASAIAEDEPRVRAKIARFLQGRGFSPGDALRALDLARRRIERESLAGD